ncbi:hypothetical protein ES708_10318 [subsurface metagenome]
MQPPRNDVGVPAELGTGVEDGHYRLQGGFLGRGVNIHGDAPPVILHPDGIILAEGNPDVGAKAGHGFVDAVVGDFIDQVVQPALVGAADVHTGTAAYRLPPLQDLDVLRPIIIIFGLGS